MSSRLKAFSALAMSLSFFLPATLHAESSFVDHRGKTITFEKPPERVVTIVRSAPIIYRAVDEKADNIVGMNKDSLTRYFTKGIYAEMLPEMAKINASAAQDGFVPNVEAILAQKPDAVIQWNHSEKLIEPLERAGLTVVAWRCCTEQDRLDYISLTGAMTGRNDRAQAILKAQADTLKTLDGKVAKLDKSAFPSVLHIDKVADQIQVIANGSQNLSLSGVTNPAADKSGEWWRTVDFEQLLVWNPDIIVIPAYATDLSPKDFFDNPVLANLKAVKEKRVYKQPVFARTPDAPEIFLTSEWLAAVAHGADFAPDFRKQIRDVYQLIYGAELTEDQLKAILESESNAPADKYVELFG
ncbi:iron complex transport system substrate-binding protein [Rhizobium sp. BK226]|uniref:ABC transporter substrate-binding protein n=1 Tax=Rhizobium TaxID=379 RepID=UPI0007B4FDF1|nr:MULTISPECIES: ABC transporter substrate-binding protein [Rhizobium]KZS55101.1 iron ABC transporter substrate-binding protein [Rhizobium anhuiense bv. trifolii]MBB3301587.1 iron complex transport system substrate-binding protein [Rhizobium sp. BK112]MBB3370943.1 iron complex transport system substrate-binding protein [Rhizobium sp. BK077]MBB3746905.1 iron complex transport system substrate-binding protein [Rhizobium sp. BK591]MBB4115369.1 iron complex transport system substrate-binding prote